MHDAVVIGAGPNGLVAANVVADHGWSVVVLEANDAPGGAVRTAEITAPGFANDLFSAFYPLAKASPVIASLGLEDHGLRWVNAPLVLAHPTAAGPTALLSTDLDQTAASLDAFAPGDGDGWRRLHQLWQRVGGPLIDSLFTPFPPVGAAVRLAAALGASQALPFARLGVLPVRRLAEEEFTGPGGGLLFAGNALHADLTPEAAGSGLYGWLLASLGQDVGFPVPEGGAQRLTDALVARLRVAGGTVECGARVTEVVVRGGRAVAARTADGREVPAAKAILADVGAPALYHDLVGAEHLPPGLLANLRRFQYGTGTVKLDWALRAPIPWDDPDIGRAGTVHLADSMDDLTDMASQLAKGVLPARPFLIVGQMTTADPTRSPPGTESAWAYAHVPLQVRGDAGGSLTGAWDERETEAFASRMEDRIGARAPGFRDLVLARHVYNPPALEAADANLVGGDVNGGTAQFHQQLVFRPTVGRARPETPIEGLYLASASAHPGGGVHGAPGANAAHAALGRERRRRRLVAAAAAGSAAFGSLAVRRRR